MIVYIFLIIEKLCFFYFYPIKKRNIEKNNKTYVIELYKKSSLILTFCLNKEKYLIKDEERILKKIIISTIALTSIFACANDFRVMVSQYHFTDIDKNDPKYIIPNDSTPIPPPLDPENLTEEIIYPASLNSYDRFGSGLSVDNGIAYIGAQKDDFVDGDGIATNEGAFYEMKESAGKWITEEKVKASGSYKLSGGEFGTRVLVKGNEAFINYKSSGLVYMKKESGSWQYKSTISGENANDYFGVELVYNGNLLVATSYRDSGSKGAAYVYSKTGDNWVLEQKLVPSKATSNSMYGYDVEFSNDLILISGHTSSGIVSVWEKQGGTWKEKQELSAPDGTPYFGVSMTTSGNDVIVSATGNGGEVYYFENKNGTIVFKEKLPVSSKESGHAIEVETGEGMLLVANTSAKKAYLYLKEGGSWVEKTIIEPSVKNTRIGFGAIMEINQGKIYITDDSRADPHGLTQGGGVFVYY